MILSPLRTSIKMLACFTFLSFWNTDYSVATDKESTTLSEKKTIKSHKKSKKKYSANEKLEHFKTNKIQKLQKKHDDILDLIEKSEITTELKDQHKATLENVNQFIALAKETTETNLLPKLRKLRSFMFEELYAIENKLDLSKYVTHVESSLGKQKKKLNENDSRYSLEAKKIFSFLLNHAEKLIEESKKTLNTPETANKNIEFLNQAYGFIKESYNIPCTECKKQKKKKKK